MVLFIYDVFYILISLVDIIDLHFIYLDQFDGYRSNNLPNTSTKFVMLLDHLLVCLTLTKIFNE